MIRPARSPEQRSGRSWNQVHRANAPARQDEHGPPPQGLIQVRPPHMPLNHDAAITRHGEGASPRSPRPARRGPGGPAWPGPRSAALAGWPGQRPSCPGAGGTGGIGARLGSRWARTLRGGRAGVQPSCRSRDRDNADVVPATRVSIWARRLAVIPRKAGRPVTVARGRSRARMGRTEPGPIRSFLRSLIGMERRDGPWLAIRATTPDGPLHRQANHVKYIAQHKTRFMNPEISFIDTLTWGPPAQALSCVANRSLTTC
jgi:hypothetical protein